MEVAAGVVPVEDHGNGDGLLVADGDREVEGRRGLLGEGGLYSVRAAAGGGAAARAGRGPADRDPRTRCSGVMQAGSRRPEGGSLCHV